MIGQPEEDGTVVRVSESGAARIPERLREEHGIETPGSVRVFEDDAGRIVVEPVDRVTEMCGFASGTGETPGTNQLRESRENDRRRDELLEEFAGGEG